MNARSDAKLTRYILSVDSNKIEVNRAVSTKHSILIGFDRVVAVMGMKTNLAKLESVEIMHEKYLCG